MIEDNTLYGAFMQFKRAWKDMIGYIARPVLDLFVRLGVLTCKSSDEPARASEPSVKCDWCGRYVFISQSHQRIDIDGVFCSFSCCDVVRPCRGCSKALPPKHFHASDGGYCSIDCIVVSHQDRC